MQRTLHLIIFLTGILFLQNCTKIPQQSWIKLIPDDATFVLTPKSNFKFNEIASTEYASILDDLIPSSLKQITGIDSSLAERIHLKAFFLFPSGSTESHLVFITETNDNIENWAPNYYKQLTQNSYAFNHTTIHRLNINNKIILAAQLQNWLVFSESGLGLENSIRSYLGMEKTIELEAEPLSGQFIVNADGLDKWAVQFFNVGYRPSVQNAIQGIKPAILTYSTTGAKEDLQHHFDGKFELKDSTRSVLVNAFSSVNKPITLDSYIADNSAGFAILRLAPPAAPQKNLLFQTSLDSILAGDTQFYNRLTSSLSEEFAVVAFPESGLLSDGEYLYLRKLSNANRFKADLEKMAAQGLISYQGSSFFIKSTLFARLIGSDLNTFQDFYLSFSGDVIAIAKRKGLAQSVDADRQRRRVISYNKDISEIKSTQPKEVSGFIWAKIREFQKFIKPFLLPDNISTALMNRFDILNMVMVKTSDQNIQFSLNTIQQEGTQQPYEEFWQMPFADISLSGEPIFGDIVGSSNLEVIYATTDGKITAVAVDGTVIIQAETDGLTPVGSPVLYDWYGNGQPIILLAAGTKIYGWNKAGNLLPKFPIEINERITTPVLVTDVLRNGIPEIVVATESGQVHVIDGRGNEAAGWPKNVKGNLTFQPVFAQVDNIWSLWAYSDNMLYSWLRNGSSRPGYPTYINAEYTQPPVIAKNQVYGSAIDGYVYSTSRFPLFRHKNTISIQQDSISIKSLYVSNSVVTSVSYAPNIPIQDSSETVMQDILIAQSANGSVLFFDLSGTLKLSFNLGQPSSKTMAPKIIDLNNDGHLDLVALGEFGRLFAWDIITGERLFDIPTNGMSYPVITDLNRDGQNELIAQTKDGLQCWTITKQK